MDKMPDALVYFTKRIDSIQPKMKRARLPKLLEK
jgi:hypothetical protein